MILVSAAIIKREDKVLIAQRNRHKSQAFKWEFPGGKIEANETVQESLERELMEELSIRIAVREFFAESIYNYDSGEIKLIAYFADYVEGEISLMEHEAVEWVTIGELKNYDFAPADIPFISKLGGKA